MQSSILIFCVRIIIYKDVIYSNARKVQIDRWRPAGLYVKKKNTIIYVTFFFFFEKQNLCDLA